LQGRQADKQQPPSSGRPSTSNLPGSDSKTVAKRNAIVAPVIRTIVLAFQIERAVREGRARDYAEVARQIGLSRARVSQIMSLLKLPPSLLETLLLEDGDRFQGLTERQLRPIIAAAEPRTQLDLIQRLLATGDCRNSNPLR